jgi:hypothetical protein
VVSAWTKGGNVPDAIVRLQATPASVTPQFSFGCGSSNGTASCDLGAMDAKSAERQLQAESMVPATESSVKSVRLSVIGSAASLPKDPKAFATLTIKGTASVTPPTPSTSPLPVGSLPGVPAANPTTGATLSPGGNASGLFPTLKPSPSSSGSASSSSSSKAALNAKARQAADTSALPESAPVIGAQLAGLAALLVAFVLAVTRFSIRRRPVPATSGPAAPATPAAPAAEPTAAPAAEPTAAPAAEPTASAAEPAGPAAKPAASATDSKPAAASEPGESAESAESASDPDDPSDQDPVGPSDEGEKTDPEA